MVGNLLLRGLLVGFVAGLLAFGFARVFGEPQVDQAIAFEEHAGHAHSSAEPPAAEPEMELVSREMQAGVGLFVAVIVYSAAIGGLFSLVFAFVHGRFGRAGARKTAAMLALAGFVAIVLVPMLKYPANPPAVGNAETIGLRTQLFLAMLIISVAALSLAVALARRLWARHGGWNATLIAGMAFFAVIAIAQLLLPDINEVPEQFSPVVLWRFRLASLGIQAVIWAGIGLLFGAWSERRDAAFQSSRGAGVSLR
jgi:predicted cobalt transporter CbtA